MNPRQAGPGPATVPPAAREAAAGCTDASDPDLLATLRALELELHHPGVPCTVARLEALLDPQFHEVGRSGRPYDRATVLRYLGSLDDAARPQVRSDAFALQRLGTDCAVLSFRSAQFNGDGNDTLHTLRASVWRRTGPGGNWRLCYHQGTPAAQCW